MSIVKVYGLESKKEKQLISLPKGARILSVCVKQERIYVSVEQDVNADTISSGQSVEFAVFKEGRHFRVDEYHFLGTVVLDFGNTIYQVFYRNH